jgi:hypothetical protein
MANVSMKPRSFEAHMRKWGHVYVPQIGKSIHKQVAEFVYNGIVTKTPVLTGRARHNWFPTNGSPSESAVEETASVSQTGQPMTAEEKARIKSVTGKLDALPLGAEKVYITNNLDYISKLEDGYSPKSPPNAMVQGTIINTLDGLKVTIKLKG